MNESVCKHCGQRIVLINYMDAQDWTHQPAGAAFNDRAHRPCHTTYASPPESLRERVEAASRATRR